MLSLTNVMPAPNSPAKPKPEIKRNTIYESVSWIIPFKILLEYTNIDPNKTERRPFCLLIFPKDTAN